jgi:hypothetical protein
VLGRSNCDSRVINGRVCRPAPDDDYWNLNVLNTGHAELGVTNKMPQLLSDQAQQFHLDALTPEDPYLEINVPMVNGQPPLGFLGYAVNLIKPIGPPLHPMGNRRALMYPLFHRVMVFDTMGHAREFGEVMAKAKACAPPHCISMDGWSMAGSSCTKMRGKAAVQWGLNQVRITSLQTWMCIVSPVMAARSHRFSPTCCAVNLSASGAYHDLLAWMMAVWCCAGDILC